MILTPNVELLERTLEYVIAHPDEHDQLSWRTVRSCGTTMCFAGHAVTLTNAQWVQVNDHWYGLVPEDGDAVLMCCGVRYVPPKVHAQRILGLTDEQAQALFMQAVDLAEVKEVVQAIIAGDPLPVFDDDEDEVEDDDQ